MKFYFCSDASCDIPEDLQKKYNISLIPIELRFGDEIFPEGLPEDEFYHKTRESSVMPKTSMPNAYKFETYYAPLANQKDVFVFTFVISTEMTGTKMQAQMAAENLGMKNVFIEDSRQTTVSLGALIVEVARFAQTHDDIEAIKAEFYRLRDKVKLFAIFDDLKYLRASGRLSGASAVIGGMLNVHPIVSITDGTVTNVAKCVGTPKAEKYLLDKLQDMDTSYPLYTATADYDNSKSEALVAKFLKQNPDYDASKIVRCTISYVVGTHVGPGVYGFVYFEK